MAQNEGGKVGAAKDPISDFSYWKIHIDLSNKFHSSPMKYRSKQIYLNIATSRTCQPYSLRHAPPASSHCPLHLAWMHNDLLSRILTACVKYPNQFGVLKQPINMWMDHGRYGFNKL